MDANTIWTIATGVAGSVGGYYGGRVFGNNHSIETAANIVEMMKTEVEVLKGRVDDKDAQLEKLTTEVGVLKELVTQRADVEGVHETVKEVKDTVEKIHELVQAPGNRPGNRG